MPINVQSNSDLWFLLRKETTAGSGAGDSAANAAVTQTSNPDVGYSDDAAASSNTGTFSLIALFKRAMARLDNIYRVSATGSFAGGSQDNAAVSGTIASPGAGFQLFIKSYSFSYSDDPASATNLTIAHGATQFVDQSVTTGGPGPVPVGFLAPENTAVAYNLPASGTSGNVGKLQVYYSIVGVV